MKSREEILNEFLDPSLSLETLVFMEKVARLRFCYVDAEYDLYREKVIDKLEEMTNRNELPRYRGSHFLNSFLRSDRRRLSDWGDFVIDYSFAVEANTTLWEKPIKKGVSPLFRKGDGAGDFLLQFL